MATPLERYAELVGSLRSAASAGAAQAWDDLGSYDDADVARYVATVAPLVVAAQAQAAVLTDAYLAIEGGRAPLGIDTATVTGGAVRAGAGPDVVYRRSFVDVWQALGNGTDWADAVSAGRARAEATAHTDVQLAMRATANEVMRADERIVGYRRVVSGASCAVCVSASGQRYHRERLLPIHPHCDCTVAPIYASRDPGRVLNRQRVRDLEAGGGPESWRERGITVSGGEVLAADGEQLRTAVHEHGELGPLLANADHAFAEL